MKITFTIEEKKYTKKYEFYISKSITKKEKVSSNIISKENWNSHDELEEDYIRTPPVIPEKEEEITNKKKDEYKYLNVDGQSITSGSSKIPSVTLHEEFTPTESEIMILKKMREKSYKTPEAIPCINNTKASCYDSFKTDYNISASNQKDIV